MADLSGVPTLLAVDRGDVAFTVTVSEDGGLTYRTELWLADGDTPKLLVRTGDPVGLGAITSIDAIAMTTREVAFVATFAGIGARHGLLAVPRR